MGRQQRKKSNGKKTKQNFREKRKKHTMAPTFHTGQFVSSFNPTMRRHSDTSLSQSMMGYTRDLAHGPSNQMSTSDSTLVAPTSAFTVQRSNIAKAKNTTFTDKESRDILRNVNIVHERAKKGRKLLYQQAEKTKRLTRDRLLLSNECFTYDQLLQELLLDHESIQFNRPIPYTYIEFKDENCEVNIKPIILEGRAYITNHRLLLVAAEQIKGTILTKVDHPTRNASKGYQVTSYHNDELHFQHLPLDSVRYVEMHTRMGGKAEVTVVSNPPCCFGLFSWFGEICGIGRCMETWSLSDEEPSGTEYTERIILIGADLPPWGTRSIVKVHVAPDVPIKTITQFLSLLQSKAGHLQITETTSSDSEQENPIQISSSKSVTPSTTDKKGKEPYSNGDVLMRKKKTSRKGDREHVYSEIQENRVQEEMRMHVETVQDNTLPKRGGEPGMLDSLRQAKMSAVDQPLPTEKLEPTTETSCTSGESDANEVDPPKQRMSAMQEDIEEIALEDLYQARHRQHETKYCACEKCLTKQDSRHWKTHLTHNEHSTKAPEEMQQPSSISEVALRLEQAGSNQSLSDDGESCV